MTEFSGNFGFASPSIERNLSRRRNTGVQLLATITLAVSLIIAATAVSIGMARAQVLHSHYLSALTSHAVSPPVAASGVAPAR